jgi:hypothetical protein
MEHVVTITVQTFNIWHLTTELACSYSDLLGHYAILTGKQLPQSSVLPPLRIAELENIAILYTWMIGLLSKPMGVVMIC